MRDTVVGAQAAAPSLSLRRLACQRLNCGADQLRLGSSLLLGEPPDQAFRLRVQPHRCRHVFREGVVLHKRSTRQPACQGHEGVAELLSTFLFTTPALRAPPPPPPPCRAPPRP